MDILRSFYFYGLLVLLGSGSLNAMDATIEGPHLDPKQAQEVLKAIPSRASGLWKKLGSKAGDLVETAEGMAKDITQGVYGERGSQKQKSVFDSIKQKLHALASSQAVTPKMVVACLAGIVGVGIAVRIAYEITKKYAVGKKLKEAIRRSPYKAASVATTLLGVAGLGAFYQFGMPGVKK
jgi:hypothetical protein